MCHDMTHPYGIKWVELAVHLKRSQNNGFYHDVTYWDILTTKQRHVKNYDYLEMKFFTGIVMRVLGCYKVFNGVTICM